MRPHYRWMVMLLIAKCLILTTAWAGQTQSPFELGMNAQTLMSKKQYQQAVDVLTTAVGQDPMNSWLRGMLANSYYQLKNFSAAKKQYELIALMEKDNELARFMVNILEPLSGLGDPAPAAEVQQKRELKPYEIEKQFGQAVLFILVADKDKKVFKTGSGFIITQDGLAVTNHHVVVDGKYIEARLPDGKQYPVAHVVNYDAARDLAVVQLNTKTPLPVITMGNSSDVVLGEQAVAIGSPEGMEHTISDGLISAWRDYGKGFKMIQISVPISHGSSGGPLFNMHGEVIGVTSAGLKEGQNLNFAIPINIVKEVLQNRNQILLADLPGSDKQETPKEKTEATDAELVKKSDGQVVCVNSKLGFAFSLTNDAWNMKESIESNEYFLKCSIPPLMVNLNIYPVKESLTEPAMVEANTKYLLDNGFVQQNAFAETTINGKRAFIGVFDKATEKDGKSQNVRSSMVLMLHEEQFYFLSMWYMEENEKQILPFVTQIRNSFQINVR